MWFKGFYEFLIGSLSTTHDKDSLVQINLAFQIYYEFVCPNKYIWKGSI